MGPGHVDLYAGRYLGNPRLGSALSRARGNSASDGCLFGAAGLFRSDQFAGIITVEGDKATARSVIRECGKRREGTWISKGIIDSYANLRRLGYAHSVETRLDGKLVGGLYGVALGGAFFGESMFHRTTDASKVALVALVERLRARGFVLLDTQWTTPHLQQFGTYEIPRHEYLWQLEHALKLECRF